MAEPVKRFSYYRAELPANIPFVLNDQSFELVPVVTGMTLLQFVAQTTQGGAGAATAVLDFLREAIIPEDWDRFVKLARDPHSGLGGEELAEIAGWMSEQYADTPTEQSSSFSLGSPTSGLGSTVVAPFEGSISVPSHLSA